MFEPGRKGQAVDERICVLVTCCFPQNGSAIPEMEQAGVLLRTAHHGRRPRGHRLYLQYLAGLVSSSIPFSDKRNPETKK